MMKHFRWLSIGAAVFLCLCLLAPLNAHAASSQKNQPRSQKSLVTGTKAAKNKVSLKQDRSKKTIARKSAKNAGRISHEESASKIKSSADKGADSGDRAIWLKRARESEVLTGKASWYGKDFHNKATASGLAYDMYTFTAAHKTLPMGTVVKVTDEHNGKSVMVCVTDRGPFVRGRVIDLSYAAAKQIGLKDRGVGKVRLEVVSDETGAPLLADQAYFIRYASENGKNKVGPFTAFSDAAAMHEALRQAHPEAEVVLEKSVKSRR